jgi:hypothetical protein
MSVAETGGKLTVRPNRLPMGRLWPVLLLGSAFVILLLGLLWSRLTGTPLDILFRDPIAVAEVSYSTGIFSHIGAMVWCASASVCIFGGILLLRSGVREQGLFLLWSGGLSTVLLIDDLFMIHDGLFEFVIGVSDKIPVAAYGMLLLWILWRFRRTILNSRWKLLAAAMVFFGVSVVEDALTTVRGDLHYLVEDGFKFLGIVAWFGYFSRHAWENCRQVLIRPREESLAAALAVQRPAGPRGGGSRAPRRWRAVRYAGAGLGVVVIVLAAAEPYARHRLGLGDPPLYVADPEVEYLFAPSRTYSRFGNTISFNSMSMRSEEFPARRAASEELRVLVLGDEVVNGGALTDQRDIATEILRANLETRFQRPVMVGNVAAGGWGAPHLLAYTNRFGFFDADIVVLVLSSHHQTRVPHAQPLVGVDPRFPDKAPVLAMQEVISRYGPQVLGSYFRSPLRQDAQEDAGDSGADERAMAAVRELIQNARAAGAEVMVVQHLTRRELLEEPDPGYLAIADLAREAGAQLIPLAEAYTAADRQGLDLYRDNLNLNQQGQRIIAEVLEREILEVVPADPVMAGHMQR